MEMGWEEAQATLWLRRRLWVLCLAGTGSSVWATGLLPPFPRVPLKEGTVEVPGAARCCRTP